MERISHRAACFFLIVSGIFLFLFPHTRTIIQLQIPQVFRSEKVSTSESNFQTPAWPEPFEQIPDGFEELEKEHPKDPRVLAQVLQWKVLKQHLRPEESQKASNFAAPPVLLANAVSDVYKDQVIDGRAERRAYDELAKQFPREMWIIAQRLRFTMRGSSQRTAGELENADNSYRPSSPPYLNRDDLTQALKMARRGQQLDPDNIFFDWCVVEFLFNLYQDEEALRVLKSAARKPVYNDYTQVSLRNELYVRSLLRPLLLEDKAAATSAVMFPHFSHHRHIARLAVWKGIQAERANNHQRAIEIYYSVANAASPMVQNQHWLITGLVGSAIQTLSWGSSTSRRPGEAFVTGNSEEQIRERSIRRMNYSAEQFSNYARTHGQNNVANQTLQQAKRVENFRELSALYSQVLKDGKFGDYVTQNNLRTVSGLWWCSISLLRQLTLVLVAWFALWAFLHFSRQSQGLLGNPLSTRLEWSTQFAMLFFITLFLGGSMLSATLFGAGSLGWEMSADIWDENVRHNLAKRELVISMLRYISLVAPLLLIITFCTVSALWRHRGKMGKSENPISKPDKTTSPRTVASFALSVGWPLTTVASWLALLFAMGEAYGILILALCIFLTVGQLVLWSGEHNSDSTLQRALNICRKLLGVTCAAGWLFWLISLVISPALEPLSWNLFLVNPLAFWGSLATIFPLPLTAFLTVIWVTIIATQFALQLRDGARKESSVTALHWIYSTLGNWILLSLVLYFITVIFSLPFRNAGENVLGVLINQGEKTLAQNILVDT